MFFFFNFSLSLPPPHIISIIAGRKKSVIFITFLFSALRLVYSQILVMAKCQHMSTWPFPLSVLIVENVHLRSSTHTPPTQTLSHTQTLTHIHTHTGSKIVLWEQLSVNLCRFVLEIASWKCRPLHFLLPTLFGGTWRCVTTSVCK